MGDARWRKFGSGVLLLGCLLLPVAGCKKEPERSAEGTGGASQAATPPVGVPVDSSTAGTVAGTVTLQGKPPARLQIDMSQDPVCSMTGGQNLAEQYVVHEGKLANVYMYVKSGPAAAMNAAPPPGSRAAAPVVLDQKGCRYTPHVIAVMRGGAVEFRNSDPTMHNIHTMPAVDGNAAMDVSQGPLGKADVHRFAAPEVMLPVRCNNHPWMNAFINVAPTPFFAVTDEAGHFAIDGLPAGQYTLGFVHERMGEKDVEIDVKAKETAKTDLSFAVAAKTTLPAK